MKKITLMLFALLLSLCGYAQLAQEGFEGTWPPPGWAIYNNGSGMNITWAQSNPAELSVPPYQGTYAAYLNRENVPDTDPAPQDWLVTKQFTAPVNPQLRFYSRLTVNGDQGGLYRVLVSTSANQADLTAYTEIQEWTETQINPTWNQYREVVVNLPANLAGQDIYVAFVMEADFKDRWVIDNVRVTERCLSPENLSAFGMTETTANLSWDTPGGATSWEVEVVPVIQTPVGSGIVYSNTLPYVVTGLTINTNYKFYVRSLCTNGEISEWAGPFSFRTVRPGESCLAPKVVTALPYSDNDNSNLYGIDYFGNAGPSCGTDSSMDSFGGSDVVYQFTPSADMVVEATVTNITDNYAGVFVYTSCNNIGTQCFAADHNEDNITDLTTGQMNLSAGTTYIIVLATPTGTPNTGYTLNINEIQCPYPSSLQFSGLTTSSANISWVEFGNATSWEYVLQPQGTGVPTGAGTAVSTTGVNLTGLSVATGYEFYVRSVCGSGDFSSWLGPLNFQTLCQPFNVPFTEGFNSDSASENCWLVLNNNGPASWNLDQTIDTYEGDEVAVLDPQFNPENNDWLISPAINLEANQRLRFHHKVTGFWGSDNNLKVLMSATGVDPEDFTTVIMPVTTLAGGDYTETEIFLNDIPAGIVHFAFVVEEGGTGAVYIDNVIIDDMPPCPDPANLQVGSITQTTAELLWTPGFEETAWEVAVQPAGSGVPTAGWMPATNPFTATGLQPNTAYEYYVRANCGGANGNSEWVGPMEFRTACEAFDVPFYEGFNSDSATEHCWKINDVNGGFDDWSTNNEQYRFEGDQSASYTSDFNSLNDDWLITPAINLTGNERLTFQHRVYNTSNAVAMELRLSTTGTQPDDFTTILLPTENYNNNFYIKEVVNLSAFTGPVYIAWHAPGGTESGMYWFLDDVRIEAIPACAEPHDLQVSNTTPTTAQLSWTPGGSETQWEVVVQPAGEGAPSAPGIITGNNPYTVNGLLSGTLYEFYVRSVCGTSTSVWQGPYPFVTVITNDECANAITVPVNPGVECIESVAGTVTGATNSVQEPYCDGPANDDVWFEFTATAATHNVSLINVSEFSYPRFGLYHGDCDNLEIVFCGQNSVNFDGLTVGDTYKIRVFTGQFFQTATFEVCVRTPQPPIAVDNTTYTVEQLVTEVLVGSECAQVSNITWSTGTNFPDENGNPNPNGIAHFTKNGSVFPMEGGILLTTGNAMSAPGPENADLGEGTKEWLGDADLDAIVLAETGTPMNSTNATVLEFDFVPLIDNLSFDFLFASEEYGTFQCDFSDTFAFLLTDQNGNTTNLAVVPGTNSPVSVVTIRDEQYNPACESVNAEYFGKYTAGIDNLLAETNFIGRTQVLTASASVVPNTQYHIKMVIADKGGLYEDTRWDSAVFLAAGSFNIGDATLGVDLTIENGNAVCANEEHTIVSGLSPEVFTFKWYKDNVQIEGATGPDLEVTESGTYKLEAEVIGQECAATDSVIIEFYPKVEDITNAPNDLAECSDNGVASFDLTLNNAVITGTQNPADFIITYHLSEADAQSGANALVSPYTNISSPQAVYARVVYVPTGCFGVHAFQLQANPAPQFTVSPDATICNGSSAALTVTAGNGATYSWSLNGTSLPDTTATIQASAAGEYIVYVTLNGCTVSASINVTVVNSPVLDEVADVTACAAYVLPALSAGNYYTGPDGTGDMLAEGTQIVSSKIIYVYAVSGTSNACSTQKSFDVTIMPLPQIAVAGDCNGGNYVVNATVLNEEYNEGNVTFEWTTEAGVPVGNNSSGITVTEEGIYKVTVTPDGLDCSITQEVTVDDINCRIQKGISPDGDGLNENFDLRGFNVKILTIFNRYGAEVYSFSNYTNQWHGQGKNGDELPTGTYFYAIERSNGESLTGWIYINRKE